MTGKVVSQKVGVRNPYALAELVQGKKINWKRKSYDKSMAALENAFDMPAERLFSPKPRDKSPLYGTNLPNIIPEQVIPQPGSMMLCSCSITGAVWQNYGKYIIAAGMEGKDPAQSGLLKNCSLVAALASCGWTRKGAWFKSVTTDDVLQSSYFFTLYDYNVTIPQFSVPPALLQYPVGTLIYTKSTTSGESWPGVVEKAYYKSREYVSSRTWTDQPDAEKFNDEAINPTGNPAAVLYHLLGRTVTSATYGSAGYTGDTIFGTLNNISTGRNPNRKILYPAVAWAKATAEASWVPNTIVPKHTYSILGVAGSGHLSGTTWIWDTKYIVLRDPFTVTRDPAFGSGDMLTTGTWNAIDFSSADGIFALRADLFPRYFQGYAYAVC